MNIGDAIRNAREDADLTQEQLARMSNVGVKTLSTFETGRRLASMKLIQFVAICRALNIRPARLLDRAHFPDGGYCDCDQHVCDRRATDWYLCEGCLRGCFQSKAAAR